MAASGADRRSGTPARTEAAFDRLDAALARLEQAATRPDPAHAELKELKDRYHAMRSRVGAALGEVDGLLTELERDD